MCTGRQTRRQQPWACPRKHAARANVELPCPALRAPYPLSLKRVETCEPSQNGLLLDAPHRHRVTRLRTSYA